MLVTDRQARYPSIERPWVKYYSEGAADKHKAIPKNKTVWDVIEERFELAKDVPAIEYFGKTISRETFAAEVYQWAKVFKMLGVAEDEVVAFYGPFTPDIAYMAMALNKIGAVAYFLKLAISPEALAEETKECKLTVVFEDMWQNVSFEFCKERFQNVIFYSASDQMPYPTKAIVKIVNKLKNSNASVHIPKADKYLSVAKARKKANAYTGGIDVAFKRERNSFITSSSGTTVGGVVKGVVATNETVLYQVLLADASDIQYYPGDKILNNLPPTASTSLNVMFFLGLYRGLTLVIDPRVSEEDFYKQIIKHHPNIILTTGSMWDSFFTRIQRELNQGKKFDFSWSTGWIVGGEGTTRKKLNIWNETMKRCGAHILYSGYGSSEVFSGIATDIVNVNSNENNDRDVIGVGVPYAGCSMGVFNKNGDELPYNTRGELWIKSDSAMKEYYNKPELTAEIKVDGWIHTGDIAEISEDGFLYLYGRCKDCVELTDGKKVFLFDIANKIIKNSNSVADAVVLNRKDSANTLELYVHIEWVDGLTDKEKEDSLIAIDKMLKEEISDELKIVGYAQHRRIPYSPTTLKKDKNRLAMQEKGFVKIVDGKIFANCNSKLQ